MRQVILLGASNLTLSFPLLVESLRAAFPEAVDLMAAHGHGRSYGMWSRVLARELPGIRTCRLWDDLADRHVGADRPLALVTDIGNDLLYGADVKTITEWVETCLARLSQRNAETVITALPMASLERMSAYRYYAARTVFFPRSRLGCREISEQARRLDEDLVALAEQFDATLVCPECEWYGIDPIHIRRGCRFGAWQEIFSHWTGTSGRIPMRRPTVQEALRLWRLPPAERRIRNQLQTRPQPAFQFSDGTLLSVY